MGGGANAEEMNERERLRSVISRLTPIALRRLVASQVWSKSSQTGFI